MSEKQEGLPKLPRDPNDPPRDPRRRSDNRENVSDCKSPQRSTNPFLPSETDADNNIPLESLGAYGGAHLPSIQGATAGVCEYKNEAFEDSPTYYEQGAAQDVPIYDEPEGYENVPSSSDLAAFCLFYSDEEANKSKDGKVVREMMSNGVKQAVRKVQRSYVNKDSTWRLIPITNSGQSASNVPTKVHHSKSEIPLDSAFDIFERSVENTSSIFESSVESTALVQMDKEFKPVLISPSKKTPAKKEPSPDKRSRKKSVEKPVRRLLPQLPGLKDKLFPPTLAEIRGRRTLPIPPDQNKEPTIPSSDKNKGKAFSPADQSKEQITVPSHILAQQAIPASPADQSKEQITVPSHILAQQDIPASPADQSKGPITVPSDILAQKDIPAPPAELLLKRSLSPLPFVRRALPLLPIEFLEQRPLPSIPASESVSKRPIPEPPMEDIAPKPLPAAESVTFSGARPKVRVTESNPGDSRSSELGKVKRSVEGSVLGHEEIKPSAPQISPDEKFSPVGSDRHLDQRAHLGAVLPTIPWFIKNCRFCRSCSQCTETPESPLSPEPGDEAIRDMVLEWFPALFMEGSLYEDVFGIIGRSPQILLQSFDRLMIGWEMLYRLRRMSTDVRRKCRKSFQGVLLDELKFLFSQGYVDKLLLKGDTDNYPELEPLTDEDNIGMYRAAIVLGYTMLAYVKTQIKGREAAKAELSWEKVRVHNERGLGHGANVENAVLLAVVLDIEIEQRKHLITADLEHLKLIEGDLEMCIEDLLQIEELASTYRNKYAEGSQQ